MDRAVIKSLIGMTPSPSQTSSFPGLTGESRKALDARLKPAGITRKQRWNSKLRPFNIETLNKGVPLRKGKAPAFTLMEVIITMTLLGFIVLIVFGVFRLGISAWERGEATKEEYQRVRIASQLISRQLKSILAYKIKTQRAEGELWAFEGKARSLKFVSAYSLKANRPSGFVFALYEFEEGEKGKGRLVFYEQRATPRDFMEEKPSEETGVPLLERIRDVRFEYYQAEDPEKNREAGWVEEWNAKEMGELPRALRMILTFAGEGEQGTEPSWVVMTSLPSYRYEVVRTIPSRRFTPPVSR